MECLRFLRTKYEQTFRENPDPQNSSQGFLAAAVFSAYILYSLPTPKQGGLFLYVSVVATTMIFSALAACSLHTACKKNPSEHEAPVFNI